jgi:hypothetical protein
MTQYHESVSTPDSAEVTDDALVCRPVEAALDATGLGVAVAHHQRLLDGFRLFEVIAVGTDKHRETVIVIEVHDIPPGMDPSSCFWRGLTERERRRCPP